MAWVKIPREHHPLFHDCLPRDPRVSTVNMFGGVAAKVNGQMFAGLFARGAIGPGQGRIRQEAPMRAQSGVLSDWRDWTTPTLP